MKQRLEKEIEDKLRVELEGPIRVRLEEDLALPWLCLGFALALPWLSNAFEEIRARLQGHVEADVEQLASICS